MSSFEWTRGPASSAQQGGAIGGAGFGLRQTDDGRVIVEHVAPGGAADKAGIRSGDWLVAVDGRAVAQLNGSQLVDSLRGPVGSQVVVVYVRGGSHPVQVTLTRTALGPAPSGEPPPPSAARAAPGALKLHVWTLRDPAANNCLAFSCLLPEGWQAQGHIQWMHEFSVLANLVLHASDPSSGAMIEWLPTQHFSYTDQMPGLLRPGQNWMGAIVAAPVTDPAWFVDGFWAPQALPHLRNRRPSAREDFPILAAQAVANDPGWQAQAVRLRYAFDHQGQPWEEDVHFTLAYAPITGGVAMWNVQSAYTCRAPRGQLDHHSATLKALVANAQFTPEWLAVYTVVRKLFRQGMAQQMADTAAFGRSLQQYNDHIRQLGQQLHEERMRSFDRIAESQREYLGGVETYTDPYAHQGVYLPTGYSECWVNEKGECLLSTQAGFNPNIGDTSHWLKMERRDPMRR